MSKLALTSVFVLAAASSTALAEEVPPAASVSDRRSLVAVTGVYVAPTGGFTSLDGRKAYVAGLRGAVMLNHRLGLGLAGNFVGTDRTSFARDEVRDVGAYGGLYVQYVLDASELLHAYADTTIGAGSFCRRSAGDACDERDFAVIEPTLNLEVNVARNVRLAVGVGYRFAIAEDGPGLSSGDLSGTVARTSLSIGVF